MKIKCEKRMRISGFLIMMMLLSGCGNSTDKTNDSNATVTTVEMTTEAATEAPDTTSPVIELASDTVAYYVGDKYDPMDYVTSVTDDKDEDIKAEYDDKNVNIASPGDYVISYSATDTAGNSTEKELNFKVKKEYTREEIKEIIQKLIDEKYYIFVCEDQMNLNEEVIVEDSVYGTLNVYGNFEKAITNVPIMGFYFSDTNIYTTAGLVIHVNSENYGRKNNNKNTLNSELLIYTSEQSGETQVCNDESVEIVSDFGKIKIDYIFNMGTFCFNRPDYFKESRTYFCFESEEQIEKLKNILESTNVSIKITRETGETSVLILDRIQCDNLIKVIKFYEDLNEYVNNIPAEQ